MSAKNLPQKKKRKRNPDVKYEVNFVSALAVDECVARLEKMRYSIDVHTLHFFASSVRTAVYVEGQLIPREDGLTHVKADVEITRLLTLNPILVMMVMPACGLIVAAISRGSDRPLPLVWIMPIVIIVLLLTLTFVRDNLLSRRDAEATIRLLNQRLDIQY